MYTNYHLSSRRFAETVNRTAGRILGVFSKNTLWRFENTLLEQRPNCHEACLICIVAGALDDNDYPLKLSDACL